MGKQCQTLFWGVIVIGVGLFIGYFGQAQNVKAGFQKISKVSDLGLKGDVKSFKVTPYKVVDNFGKVEKTTRVDYWRGDIISFFDKQGFKVQNDRFDKAGQLLQRIFYKYDSKGNRTARDAYDGSGKVVLRHIYVYSPKGHPMACNGYDPNSGLVESFTYKTNDKGQITEETCVKSLQPTCNNYELTYERDGKQSSTCIKTKTDNNCEKYTYNKQGRIEQIDIYSKGNLKQKQIISYDEKGNEKNIKVFNADNVFQEEREYTYTYDDKGNWIERVEYINKFPKLILEREIIYHQ